MASKKTSPMDFIVAALKKNKKASYADIKAAANKKGLTVWPIMYGRAKLLLGMVKPGKKKSAKKSAKRGPGRPKGSKNKQGPGRPKGSKNKRRVGRPRKAAARRGRPRKVASATAALQGLVAGMKATERENERLRGVLERIAGLIGRAV